MKSKHAIANNSIFKDKSLQDKVEYTDVFHTMLMLQVNIQHRPTGKHTGIALKLEGLSAQLVWLLCPYISVLPNPSELCSSIIFQKDILAKS